MVATLPNALDVWMNGQLVGTWQRSRALLDQFTYAESWVASTEARPLSVSLPLPANHAADSVLRGPVVEHFFDNLLPDNPAIRQRLRTRHQTKSTRAFDLLAAIGRDCVGAVQLLPGGESPTGFDKIHTEPLDHAAVADLIRAASGNTVLGQTSARWNDFRISIAGAQEKTALLRIDGAWHRPLNATPTTHILKLPLGLVGNLQVDMRDSVENEWLCAKLMRAFGFNVAHAEIARFGDQKVLVVERFDRRWVETATLTKSGKPGRTKQRWIARLPQEDFCQALGIAGDRKYESDGGPGVRAGLALLDAGNNAAADKLQFALAQLAFWLLAATDGHAKNFSIHMHRGGFYQMTPLYDILSAWPIIGRGAGKLEYQKAQLAMAIRGKNAHTKLGEIQTRHWAGLARQTGVPGAFARMVELVETADAAVERATAKLPKAYPVYVAEKIVIGVGQQVRRFWSGLAASGMAAKL